MWYTNVVPSAFVTVLPSPPDVARFVVVLPPPPPPPPPPPELIDGHLEHEVEAVINSKPVGRGRKRSMMYLVKWKGLPDSEIGWEPVANMENAQEAIEDYHKAHPRKTRV